MNKFVGVGYFLDSGVIAEEIHLEAENKRKAKEIFDEVTGYWYHNDHIEIYDIDEYNELLGEQNE